MGFLKKIFGNPQNSVQKKTDAKEVMAKEEKMAKEEASLSRKGAQAIVGELKTIRYETNSKDYPKEKLDILKTGIQKIADELEKADTLILDTTVIDDYVVKIVRVLESGIRNGDEDTIKYTYDYLRKILLEERREIIAIDDRAAAEELQQKKYTAEKMYNICRLYDTKGQTKRFVKKLSEDIRNSQIKYEELREELAEFEKEHPELKLEADTYIAGQETASAIGDVITYVNKNTALADMLDEIEARSKLRAEREGEITALEKTISETKILLEYTDFGLPSDIQATIDRYVADLVEKEEERRDSLNKLEEASKRFYATINTVTADDRRRAADTMRRVQEIKDREKNMADLQKEAKQEHEVSKKTKEENSVTNNSKPTMMISD